jgi:hypothetical protein
MQAMAGDAPDVDLDALRRELKQTAQIPDQTEQMLEVAAIVDAAVAAIGPRPIVVGGLAVAYWTTGLYLTGDIDVVMPVTGLTNQRLAALGFEREGRFWFLPGRETMFEAPSSALEFNPDGFTEVQLRSGRAVRIQDVEEIVLLRLDRFVKSGNADVFRQCLLLLGTGAIDPERLERRAEEQSLRRAVDALRDVAAGIAQRSVSLDHQEIEELARSLREGSTER